jgi:hypothetical protein
MLEVSFAALADAANVSQEGKLNVTGIFTEIYVSQVPATHPWMVLVFMIEGDRSDAQAEHKMKLDLIDADGESVLPPIEGPIKFGGLKPGRPLRAPHMVNIANVQFKKIGEHELKIILNGEVRAAIPINIVKR